MRIIVSYPQLTLTRQCPEIMMIERTGYSATMEQCLALAQAPSVDYDLIANIIPWAYPSTLKKSPYTLQKRADKPTDLRVSRYAIQDTGLN